MRLEDIVRFGRSEWLLTNGLGGFALGTVSGIPERRYHGMLIGSTRPPVGRVMGLNAVAETVTASLGTPRGKVTERRAMSSFRFRAWDGEFARPPVGFGRDEDGVTWTYRPFGAGAGVEVRKRLRLIGGRNAVEVGYEVTSPEPCTLELSPLTALRDMHALTHGGEGTDVREEPGGIVRVRRGSHVLRLAAAGARPEVRPDWWWRFEYARERERRQESVEDMLSPCRFVFDAPPGGGRVRLLAWMDDAGPPAEDESASRRDRLRAHSAFLSRGCAGNGRAGAELAAAADQFVVRRDSHGGMTTVIAGYPWFADWGRDTMIALPGLMLATGRFEEALGTLRGFAAMQRDGLVPNCFDDSGECRYNTVDASLWFVHACLEYLRASGDRAGFDRTLRPACQRVIDAYRRGTDFGIRMDPEDGLIAAGDETTQLTWMDAARDGVVFTPRAGKPVEVNALWHSVLRRLGGELGDLASRVAGSFAEKYWNEKEGCLFDVLPRGGGEPSAQIRPNQVYAVSLEHSALPPAKQRAVLASVRWHLLTPRGLRTLAPTDPSYRGWYEGDMMQRDGAYHNGTVWPYLLGAYAEAVLRVGRFSAEARAEVQTLVEPLIFGLLDPEARGDDDGPLGTIAEVYDGDEPRHSDGCPAQAWSVAEVLRAWRMAADATLG